MTELVINGSNSDEFGKETDAHYVPNKENFSERSPRSPLNTHSPPMSTMSPENDSIDLAMDGVADTSIEQLYHNVCEMQSSDHSPSRRSFLSYGEESRIDSELRFFAGGDYTVTEVKKEVVTEQDDEKKSISPTITEQDGEKKSISATMAKEASKKSIARNKSLLGKPPKGIKMLGAFASMKKEKTNEENGEAGYLGPYLLKQARDMIISGDKSQKALELALRAMKQFEMVAVEKPNLDYVLCLHVVASLYCGTGRYSEAIPVLEKSIDIPVMDMGQNHALAKFSGCMQLGDTYAMIGQIENSILLYTAGLEIQRQVLGEKDPRFGETCRYLAEAHVQAMQFDEAEKLCLVALDIHKQNGASSSPEEAADRRLLGLICDSKGEYESALEHYVLASMSMAANSQTSDVASIDCNIGDAYLALACYDEAVFAYQKALSAFKSNKGENHLSVASVYVRLGDLYNKIGKFGDAKSYSENALRIYLKPTPGSPLEEIASGLVEISAILESMGEFERALQLLQKAIKAYGNALGQQSTIAGIEAQMGVLYYMMGSYSDSYNSLKNAILKFRATGEKKSALFGIALNQMGLACVQLFSIEEAAALFEEARDILEAEYGPYNADTLGVYSNLAGTYDAMGRNGDAIEILEYILKIREEKLGTANPEVEDEKWRLAELLKEAGLVRNRKSRSLETLLVNNSHNITSHDIEVL